MDYIKISLIGLIAVFAYYLLLQWPPSSIEGPLNPTSAQENTIAAQDPVETILLKEEVLIDSKDLLSALGGLSSSGDLSAPGKQIETDFARVFSLNNDVLNIEIDAITGRFVKAGMKDIKVEKDGDESVSLFGHRLIDAEDGCPVEMGATLKGHECVGNYFASSGFYSASSGYLDPNFKSIEKLTMGDGGVVYILSGENTDMHFTRRVLLRPGE